MPAYLMEWLSGTVDLKWQTLKRWDKASENDDNGTRVHKGKQTHWIKLRRKCCAQRNHKAYFTNPKKMLFTNALKLNGVGTIVSHECPRIDP